MTEDTKPEQDKMPGKILSGWMFLASLACVPVLVAGLILLEIYGPWIAMPVALALWACAELYRRSQRHKSPSYTKAVLIWALSFVPLFVFVMAFVRLVGLGIALPAIFAGLACVLLYQRYRNKRSWNAIMWGDRHG